MRLCKNGRELTNESYLENIMPQYGNRRSNRSVRCLTSLHFYDPHHPPTNWQTDMTVTFPVMEIRGNFCQNISMSHRDALHKNMLGEETFAVQK